MFGRRRDRLGVDYTRGWSDGVGPGRRPLRRQAGVDGGEGAGRARVLIESDDGAEATALVRILERAGYRSAWCPGPKADDGRDCPLVRDGHCPLVEQADAVVSTLSLEDAGCRKVLGALPQPSAGTPVVVAVTQAGAARWARQLAGRHVLRLPLTARGLIKALADSLG